MDTFGAHLVPADRRNRVEAGGTDEVDLIALAVVGAVDEGNHVLAGPDVRTDVSIDQPGLFGEFTMQRREMVFSGVDAATLAKASRVDLADSALHAPAAGFGDEDFYPDIYDKAAVLCCRLAWNHPLPDGNKRASWAALLLFVVLGTVSAMVFKVLNSEKLVD